MRPSFAVLAVLLAVPSASPGGSQIETPRIIHITAERFTFAPSEITVREGTTVELRLTSEDTTHGFRLLGPGSINVEIPKRGRGEARVTFEATQPGRYSFECSHVCGAGHSFMRGILRVEPRPTDAAADRSFSQKGGSW